MKIIREQAVVTDSQVLDEAWQDPETFIYLPNKLAVPESWIQEKSAAFPEFLRTDHFVLLSSGSTGDPKLIVGARNRAEALARVLHEAQQSEPVSESILALPLSYCYAFVNQWLWARLTDRHVVFSGGFQRPEQLRDSLMKARHAMLCLVGAQVKLLEEYFGTDIKFPGVIRLHFAGGMFPQHKIEYIRAIFPNAGIFNNYGCAEAMPRLTVRCLDESSDATNIGRPIPGVALKLGAENELLFQSSYRAVAYHDYHGVHLPTDDDWVATGDIGESLEQGYWKITGRNNEVYKRYGEKISLPLLAESISRVWAGQMEFYREKNGSSEEGHVLVLTPHASEIAVRDILMIFRHNYSRAFWPLRIESVAEFPRLDSGKIDKIALKNSTTKSLLWRQIG